MSARGSGNDSSPLPEGWEDDATLQYNPNRTAVTGARHVAWSREGSGDPPNTQEELPPAATAFEFERIIGEGGFGIVWQGKQKSLKRVVAIKKVREQLLREAESDPERGSTVTGWFRAEALTAAQLDHPNIVPVYDLGRDDSGRPLLAMKMVDGKPWDMILAEDFPVLDVEDFLAKHIPILLDVARAVAFAHSRGIVHRDLKPPQVMVGEYGEVLLMDWGLAVLYDVALLQKGTGRLVHHGGVLTCESASNPAGTPVYMAPEQTEDTARNIGPWTDVYLLGGTLFTVLTGSFPRPGRGVAQVMEKARRGEVADPASLAPGRGMPEELLSLMHEAMKPAIGDRTLTAKQFVGRLQDYLAGTGRRRESAAIASAVASQLNAGTRDYEELSDCIGELGRARVLWPGNPAAEELTEGALHTFGRVALGHGDFVLARVQGNQLKPGTRRHALMADIERAETRAQTQAKTRRMALRATVGLLGMIAMGSLLFNYRLQWESRQRVEALERAEAARGESFKAREEAIAARKDAQKLVSFMINDLQGKLSSLGKLEIMDALLDQVASQLTRREKAGMDDSENAFQFQTAFLVSSVRQDQGDLAAAEAAISQAVVVAEARAAADPSKEIWQAMISTGSSRMSDIMRSQGKLAEALKASERSVGIAQKLVAARLDDVQRRLGLSKLWNQLGELHEFRGNLDDAVTAEAKSIVIQRELVKEYPTEPSLIDALNTSIQNLAGVKASQGNLEEALALQEESLALCKSMAESDPGNTNYQRSLCGYAVGMGDMLVKLGRTEEAMAQYREALAIAEKLSALDPANADLARDVSVARNRIGITIGDQDKDGQAVAVHKLMLENMEKLASSDPSNFIWQRDLAVALNNLGGSLLESDALESARGMFERSREINTRLLAQHPDNPDSMIRLSTSIQNLGAVAEAEGKLDEALEAYQKNVDLGLRALELNPANVLSQKDLAIAWGSLGLLFVKQRRLDEACDAFAKDLELCRKLVAEDPKNVNFKRTLAVAHSLVGNGEYLRGRMAEARKSLEAGLSIMEPIASAELSNSVYQRDVGKIAGRLGDVLTLEGKPAEAKVALGKALSVWQKIVESKPGDAGRHGDLAWTLCGLGRVARSEGALGFAEARAALVRAREMMEPIVATGKAGSGGEVIWGKIHVQLGNLDQAEGKSEAAGNDWRTAAEWLGKYADPARHETPNIIAYATALIKLDRKEEARPLIDFVIQSGFPDEEFRAEVKRSGMDIP